MTAATRAVDAVKHAKVRDLVLQRERHAMKKEADLPTEELEGIRAAAIACRRELGEATSQQYAEQQRGYVSDFGAALSSTRQELDEQETARAHAATPRKQQPPGQLSPRQLHLASPLFGHQTAAWRPPHYNGANFSMAVSDSQFLAELPPGSPRRLPPLGSPRTAAEESHASDGKWGPRWVPVTGSITRLKIPGAAGTQDHIYAKRSPRGLIPSLAHDDPVLVTARLLEAEGLLHK